MSPKYIQTDVLIVGAGPVGLFAVFQCGMLGIKTHVIDCLSEIGGQCTALYPEKPIYDIPAYPKITGEDLIEQLILQAQTFSPIYHLNERVLSLEKKNNKWHVVTSLEKEFEVFSIVLAAGNGIFDVNRPPLKDLHLYEDRSIFYYIRNKEKFTNASVVIAGGGDSAIDWAIELKKIAKSVTVVHRRAQFRSTPDNQQTLETMVKNNEIGLKIPYQLFALEGNDGVLSHVILAHIKTKETLRLPADYLLPFFGLVSKMGPLNHWGLTFHENNRQILVDPSTQQTNLQGVFAIGDICAYPHKLKLILTGFSEAAHAARAIYAHMYPNEALHFEHSTTLNKFVG